MRFPFLLILLVASTASWPQLPLQRAGDQIELRGLQTAVPLPASYYPASSYSSGFTLSKGNLVGVVSLPAAYTVSFDLFPVAAPSDNNRNIVHLSATNTNNQGAGSRLPGVWFCAINQCPNLGITAWYMGSETQEIAYSPQALQASQWSTVFIYVDMEKQQMVMAIAGPVTFSVPVALSTPVQSTWPTVYVYASDPWYPAPTAQIRNLVIAPPTALPASFYPASSYASGFTLSKGNLVGVVSLPVSYKVSFDLNPTAVGSGWRNIIHLTVSGFHSENAGSR